MLEVVKVKMNLPGSIFFLSFFFSFLFILFLFLSPFFFFRIVLKMMIRSILYPRWMRLRKVKQLISIG